MSPSDRHIWGKLNAIREISRERLRNSHERESILSFERVLFLAGEVCDLIRSEQDEND